MNRKEKKKYGIKMIKKFNSYTQFDKNFQYIDIIVVFFYQTSSTSFANISIKISKLVKTILNEK